MTDIQFSQLEHLLSAFACVTVYALGYLAGNAP